MAGLSPFDEGYVAPEPEPTPEPKAKASTPPPGWSEPTGTKPKASAKAAPRAAAPPPPKVEHPTDYADGIYFDLPFDAYCAIERLSSTGIQKLIASPAEFWASSWLNHEKPEDEEKPHQVVGRAYHAARLEPELFARQYVRELARSDFPAEGACWTGSDIEAQLAAMGLAKTKAGETVGDKGKRLHDAGYSGTIFPLEQARWAAALNGRTPIAGKVWREIEIDGERLRSHPAIAALLSGGAAEVTVLWTDGKGRKMKARLDYLRPIGWTDLKTFDPKGKALEQAIPDAIRFNLYFVQAAIYREAVEAIRHGVVEPRGDVSEAHRELVAQVRMNPDDPECWYLFNQKGGVPNILGRRFHFLEVPTSTRVSDAIGDAEGIARQHRATERTTQLHRKARILIRRAKRIFDVYSEVYEPGQAWLPINPLDDVTDDLFNEKWLEAE